MVILIQCNDRVGLVAAIADVLAKHAINIVSMREHVDTNDNRFFVRIVVNSSQQPEMLQQELTAILPTGANITVNPTPQKK